MSEHADSEESGNSSNSDQPKTLADLAKDETNQPSDSTPTDEATATHQSNSQTAVLPQANALITITPPAETFPLGERLRKLERHPVLLFGTTSSGKSTILMSFINNLSQNTEVSIRLGDPIYPAGHPRHDEAQNFAIDFFENKSERFMNGREMLKTTEAAFPLFIPIDVQRTGDDKPVKFAFLEGKGEWFEPSGKPTGTIFQDLKAEVADVLKYFDGGLSAIFVAPWSNLDSEKRLRDNDVGLLGAINAYKKFRTQQDDDSLLFLMTKWDMHANPINDSTFGHLQADDVSSVLTRQYPSSWPAFQAMPRSPSNDRRYFMQYCAGYLQEETNRPPPARQKSVFDRYPRTLLNWLYGNATRTPNTDGRSTWEEVLFPEVIHRETVRIVERVTNFILAR